MAINRSSVDFFALMVGLFFALCGVLFGFVLFTGGSGTEVGNDLTFAIGLMCLAMGLLFLAVGINRRAPGPVLVYTSILLMAGALIWAIFTVWPWPR